ncbi:outer membrane biogenesis protein BamB [Symmachiella dynata]|uniref:Outer membrane biogenesis protein BamB n=1 Tax=Symmachiella dynata TaxID=2527995 RepID=A0A517ZYY4_9PLAN|nr:PQQ-binding-like beta-propeller repeat protein [Symmachiella dynata]QDU47653.1 outer membrane biogenesis protein BamB [Symmachiella dynata]
MLRNFLIPALLVLFVSPLSAADWTQFRGNAARDGYTADSLPAELSLAWVHHPAHPPQTAWPRDDRMLFDRAFHVVAAGDTVFYGSSADGQIHALDAATGQEKWTFYTDGPVRFAPVVWRDQVYAVSDDGYLYCLSAADGSLIRKWRGGPEDDMVLGNGTLTSRWPARGGPVIVEDTLYYAAGIWQSEKVFLHALDLTTGESVWTNGESGQIEMPQPHGGANANSGISAQGYVVAAGDQLFVPTGRAVPAAFQRTDGAFQYYHLQKNGHTGGTSTMASGPFFYNGGLAFVASDGEKADKLGAGAVAAFPEGLLHADGHTLRALKPVETTEPDRRGQPQTKMTHKELWKAEKIPGGTSLIVAGDTIVSGASDSVATFRLEDREQQWTAQVDGKPYGLAVAAGRLYVSTDQGTIYCFAAASPDETKTVKAEPQETAADELVAKAAEEIIKTTGVTAGYCVDFGCGDGRLALELAKQTDLMIFAVDSDPANVAAARQLINAAGLYGTRVTVHQRDLAATTYPKYFANLIVSGRSVAGEEIAEGQDEIARLQRPYGGMVCLGAPGEMSVKTRGALADAGQWTHQYSNPANTCSSVDTIKGPLSILWFRDVALEMPQRHGRGHAPLFHQGRLFVEGMDALRAVDAYNGRTLWEYALPGVQRAHDADHLMGTAGTGSNFCAAGDSVFVRRDDICVRLDAAIGEVLTRYEAPQSPEGKKGKWGYIACEDGILFGSVVNEDHIVQHSWKPADMSELFTESKMLFAFDVESGEKLWQYDAQESIRNNAIAIGDGQVFLIDRALAPGDRLDQAEKRRGKTDMKPAEHPTGELVILNARSGKIKMKNDKDIFGTVLVFSEANDMLLMSYQPTRFRLPSEVGGRIAVFRASEGYRVWDKPMKYVTRPLVTDRTIYTQGGAWDLLTGETQPFEFKRSYGCGQLAAGKNMLLFRSATLGYLDLSRPEGREDFGGIRPGCWINALPVGGLVLLPDASAGCRCSYQNRAWVAFQGSD